MIEPIFPLFIVSLGASEFELGLIMATFSIVVIITRIPLATASESIGKWSVILLALLVQSLSFVLYFLAAGPSWFYPIRALHGLATAALMPAALAIASGLAPIGKRGETMGRYLTVAAVAMMVGPFLCGLFTIYLNYRQIFLLTAVLLFFCAAAILLWRLRSRTEKLSDEDSIKGKRAAIWVSLRGILRSRNVLILSFARVTFSISSGIFVTLFSVYALEELFLAPSLIGVLFAMRGVTNTLIRTPVGRVSDKAGRKKPLLFAFISLALVFILLSEAKSFFLLVFAMGIYGVAWGVRAVCDWALLIDSVSSDERSLAIAYLGTMHPIGEAIGSLVAGAASLIFPIPTIFKISALIVFPGILVVSMAKEDFTSINRHFSNRKRAPTQGITENA